MKRQLAVILAIALAIGLTACSTKSGQPGNSTTQGNSSGHSSTNSQSTNTGSSSSTAATGMYKDGTYDAKADPWDYGQEEAIVTVKDGKIADVTLKRLDKNGAEIDYTMFDGKTHDGKVYPNLKEDRFTMAKRMVEKQSPMVDTIAGATVSTKNWTIAAERALAKAK